MSFSPIGFAPFLLFLARSCQDWITAVYCRFVQDAGHFFKVAEFVFEEHGNLIAHLKPPQRKHWNIRCPGPPKGASFGVKAALQFVERPCLALTSVGFRSSAE